MGFQRHHLPTIPDHHRNRALVLDLGGCGLSLVPTSAAAYQQPPIALEIGFLWPPPLNRAFTLGFDVWASADHHQASASLHNHWKRVFALVSSGCVLSLWPLSLPPPSTSSHHLRFWPNRAFSAVMGLAAPPTNHPTTPENERSRSFLVVVGFLWLPPPLWTPITPEMERACSFSAVVGFLWPPPNLPPPKSNIRARFWWLWAFSGHPHLPQPITHSE